MTDRFAGDKRPERSRASFLGGIGASLALTACSGVSVQPKPQMGSVYVPDMQLSLRELMRKAQCAYVEYGGVRYNADGTHTAINPGTGSRQPLCGTATPLSRLGPVPELCVATPVPSPPPPVTVGLSFAEFPDFGAIGWGLKEPIYTVGPAQGPVYKADNYAPCDNPIPDAHEIALGAAEYVMRNAAVFSAAVVNAATAAINNWRGTGLGIAASITAAMEFLGFLGVALTFSEFLAMLLGIGIVLGVIYLLWECFNG